MVAAHPNSAAGGEPLLVRVSEIGEFIRFRSCERRFKLGLQDRRLAKHVPFSERLFNTLDPVLQEVGRTAEDKWEAALRGRGLADLSRLSERTPGQRTTSWTEFRPLIESLGSGTSAYGREVEVAGRIGAFDLSGRIDFFVVLWNGGTPRIRIVEGKASRKDRTYHRIQLAAYIVLLRRLIAENPLRIGGHLIGPESIEGTVARIDEITNEPQDIIDRPMIDLDTEIADFERLVADDGLLSAIRDRNLDELDFQLDAKCDGCVFSVHCLPESARQRRLELTGIPPTTCRVLREHGVATIDALAALDPASPAAAEIKQSGAFDNNLPQLIALAAARTSTLPRGEGDPDNYQVQNLPHAGAGQLPLHVMGAQRLVRVYLQVDYDYSENRIGALSAHITNSEFELHTPFDANTRRPSAEIVERRRTSPEGEPATYEQRPILSAGRDVVVFQTNPWTGIGDQDSGAERQMLQQFIYDVIDAISEVAQAPRAPIHFYVYSRSEMTQLVEACTRGGASLLSHLRELLGSRESLEQLIFSCVQDEIGSRYALGWTGRGLCVATSLSWYGQRYHWTRRVGGQASELDRYFEQDIFDFRTTLEMNASGGWARGEADSIGRHRFEIRSRFHDTLTAPYWRAVWRALPDEADPLITDQRIVAAIKRYNRIVERPGLLKAYLAARVHALRWLDERVRFKNPEIEKPPLEIARLHEFDLGIDTTARAAIDFLRLDHHVGMTDWLTSHIQPPAARVQAGRTIPVRNARTNVEKRILADFDLTPFGLTGPELSLRTGFDGGSFVRLSPRDGSADRGQTLAQLTRGGITCTVRAIDWETGRIELDPLFSSAGTYLLGSWTPDANGPVFDFGTIDESPSDFVAGRVEHRLRSALGGHVFEWFEPSDPRIPAQDPLLPAVRERIAQMLSVWQVPYGRMSGPLTGDQAGAVADGLQTRVQLLKGPPGTGKTVTTAASILARAIARLDVGQIILVGAHTNRAVDTLMERIRMYSDSFRQEAIRHGAAPAPIVISRVHSNDVPADVGTIRNFAAKPSAQKLKSWLREGVVVIGGTTGALLKMSQELGTKTPYRNRPQRFQAEVLIVDEASMMVFPHFLALSSLVLPTGEIMLAGDNRQLAPIVAHDWENEDRPPAQYYQPFKSAYEGVLRIIDESAPAPAMARQSALTYTFRLPPIIRELIARLYRSLDAIELAGTDRGAFPPAGDEGSESWARVWEEQNGLVLVVHSERGSRQSNPLEAEIIRRILVAADNLPADSVAIITPHRAQRAMLRGFLQPHAAAASVIDTVERLQGGERPVIIVSGTESDPHAIGAAASFILNLNRSNVAFSRTQERLIVVCAETLLDHIPAELEDYESAMLWKSLRALCNRPLLATEIDGVSVRVLAPVVRDPGRG